MRGLSHSDRQLINASKLLEQHWEITASSWRDKARADFEKAFMEELRFGLKGSIGAVTEINRVLRQAVQECS